MKHFKRNLVISSLVGVLVGVAWTATIEPRPSYMAAAVTSATQQGQYRVLRTVTSNDTALDPNDKYWDSIQTTWFSVPDTWNKVELAFLAYGDGTGDGDPNAGNCKIKVMAARWLGSAKTVFEGEVGIGELEASCDPESGTQYNSGALDPNQSYKWADAIDANGLGDMWPSGVTLSDPTDTTGNLATLTFDCTGFFKIFVLVTEKSGWTSLKPVITGY